MYRFLKYKLHFTNLLLFEEHFVAYGDDNNNISCSCLGVSVLELYK